MSDQDKAYADSIQAWLDSNQADIDSCHLKVRHFEKEIELLQKRIMLEDAERAAKLQLRAEVISEFNSFMKDRA